MGVADRVMGVASSQVSTSGAKYCFSTGISTPVVTVKVLHEFSKIHLKHHQVINLQ